MKKVILIWAAAIVLFAIALYTVKTNPASGIKANSQSGSSVSQNTSSPSIQLSYAKTKAPDFVLKDLNGKEIRLSDYKGKKVYLNFWTTWCPACKEELPSLEKLYEETKDSNLVILTIDLGEDKGTVGSFLDSNKYSFNVLLDTDRSISEKYGIVSIPTSIFIDKDGNIAAKKVGAMTLDEMKSYISILDKN